jgi:hypothetical protein
MWCNSHHAVKLQQPLNFPLGDSEACRCRSPSCRVVFTLMNSKDLDAELTASSPHSSHPIGGRNGTVLHTTAHIR